MNKQKREAIFARFEAANPHPTTELEYNSVFQLLIAVILSAQATDKSVNIATRELFKRHGTPQKMLKLGVHGVTDYIKTIGLFRTKAKNVIATCQQLVEQHAGEVPRDREALEALPGVGRKTANVVLNTAFGEPTMAVDTHIFRVANRTGIAPGKTVLSVEKALLKFVPPQYLQNAHHWLILHGRYVCVARNPKCEICGIADLCEYKYKQAKDKTKNAKSVTQKPSNKGILKTTQKRTPAKQKA
ncbi:endonuclease III [Orrella daihaiensis]|uniref:Endonuclease III n=1 Tax=Orrella daihaiensis TaxID=2782176 RepID=A0ABY4AHQ4_9BURK|nr:endonuclease III [Orrella daihaiensis]UOD49613.1 endonuclease III [Orrella daihaiensis]